MSNTERQRLFRERHPGYYQRLHAKRRARVKAALPALQVKIEMEVAAKLQAWREAIVPPVRATHLLPAADECFSISQFLVLPRVAEMAVLREARELRDRYLEEVQRDPLLILPTGKYEVGRQLADVGSTHSLPLPEREGNRLPLLKAA